MNRFEFFLRVARGNKMFTHSRRPWRCRPWPWRAQRPSEGPGVMTQHTFAIITLQSLSWLKKTSKPTFSNKLGQTLGSRKDSTVSTKWKKFRNNRQQLSHYILTISVCSFCLTVPKERAYRDSRALQVLHYIIAYFLPNLFPFLCSW